MDLAVFGAVQMLNRKGTQAFSAGNEREGENFAAAMGVILESRLKPLAQKGKAVSG